MDEILIHLFDVPQEIFEKLFKKKGEIIQKDFGKIEKRYPEKKIKNCNWIGYLYPKLSLDNIINKIFLDVINSIKQSKNKKNIIIKFGKNYFIPFRKMINAIETDHPFILFNFSEDEVIENDYFDKFKLPQYISYIKDKYDPQIPDLNLHKIWSYIWEKDCYYNERGNSECKFSPANLLYKPSKGFIFFNILLIGESRAGKSYFINRMFNKFVTYETGKLESSTKEITYYELSWPDNPEVNEKNKLIKKGYGLIRILDTPGIVQTKDLDAYSKIIDKIDKKFDNIHMIYFFLKGQSNIEQSIGVLKYIKKKNIEREKNNLNKIPMIFIKNGEDLEPGGNGKAFFQELKNILNNNNLLDLYAPLEGEKNDNKQSKKEINFLSEEDEEEDLNNYENYINGNIIQIYLPKGKNLNKIFFKSKQYLLKNNSLILEGKLDNEFNLMRENANTLIQFYIKEKLEKKSLTKDEKNLYEKLYKECNEFSSKLCTNGGSVLYNLDILKVKIDPIGYLILGIISCLVSFFVIPLFIYAFCFYKIQKNIISNIASSLGFSEEDINFYGLDKYIYSEKFLKDLGNNEKSFGKIKKFFKDIIYFIGPIQSALKARDSLFQISEIFEKFSNKKDEDWNKFKVEKI